MLLHVHTGHSPTAPVPEFVHRGARPHLPNPRISWGIYKDSRSWFARKYSSCEYIKQWAVRWAGAWFNKVWSFELLIFLLSFSQGQRACWKSEHSRKQTHCNTLQHTATHCYTLQHTANTATHCNTHCHTLPHTATHCNTLQHTAYLKQNTAEVLSPSFFSALRRALDLTRLSCVLAALAVRLYIINVYVYIHIHIHIYICIHTHTHIYIYIHVYIHICIRSSFELIILVRMV